MMPRKEPTTERNTDSPVAVAVPSMEQNPERSEEISFFERLAQFTEDEWRGLKLYVYWLWPVIDKKDSEHFLSKLSPLCSEAEQFERKNHRFVHGQRLQSGSHAVRESQRCGDLFTSKRCRPMNSPPLRSEKSQCARQRRRRRKLRKTAWQQMAAQKLPNSL
jgi:hypothetical protein